MATGGSSGTNYMAGNPLSPYSPLPTLSNTNVNNNIHQLQQQVGSLHESPHYNSQDIEAFKAFCRRNSPGTVPLSASSPAVHVDSGNEDLSSSLNVSLMNRIEKDLDALLNDTLSSVNNAEVFPVSKTDAISHYHRSSPQCYPAVQVDPFSHGASSTPPSTSILDYNLPLNLPVPILPSVVQAQ